MSKPKKVLAYVKAEPPPDSIRTVGEFLAWQEAEMLRACPILAEQTAASLEIQYGATVH